MKKIYFAVLLITLCVKISHAQQGKDGAKVISINKTVVNEYTSLAADANSGNTSITVANNALNTHGRFSASLSAGDMVLIIQMQGASIKGYIDDSTWGAITGYNNCGLNELALVSGVSGSIVIELQCPLQNNYTALGNVQVVRVPRFSSLTVNSGDTLTCDSWSGAIGGVLAVEVSGNIVINSGTAIDATGKGFRGGPLQNQTVWVWDIFSYASLSEDTGGVKGESIAGYENDYTVYGGMYGRGAPANGGGGGTSTNSSGGGGANAGNINAWSGNGNPDITTNSNYALAWNLEYNGFANATSSGGGRGGYGASNQLQNPLYIAPGNHAWGTLPWCYRDNIGGKGGRPLDYSSGRLFLGGGGGEGHENENFGGSGGNGGGLIYILSSGTVDGGGAISSNGENGGNDNSQNSDGDGAGGAGSGGTVIVESSGNISGVTIYANGGTGGNQYITTSMIEAEGGGGGGGGGYVATSNGGIGVQVNGGANGTSNSNSVSLFPPNGGTMGGKGIDTTISSCTTQLSAITGPVSVCAGGTYTYSVTARCGTSFFVWNLPSGWTGSSTTNSIIVTVGSDSGTISVSSCPLDTSLAISVNPAPVLIIQPPSPVVICSGQGVTLIADTTGSDYRWSPAVGLGATAGDSVLANPTADVTYTVTGIDSLGCSVTGMEVVEVKAGPNKPKITVSVTGDTLFSSAQNGNQWYRNGIPINGATDSILVITGLPIDTYKVVVTNAANGCGTASDSITSGIYQPSLSRDQLTLYPNPTDGIINLVISPSTGELHDWNLQLINVLGQTIYTRASLSNTNEINLSGFSAGVYIIIVTNATARAVVPVIKR